MNEIGKRIELVRRRLDMSMEEFGNRIGISRASVSRLERGINNPAQRTIMLIAEKFGISERWLRNGTGEMIAPAPSTDDLVSTLAAEYSLTENDMLILRAFLALSESDRQAFLRFGKELVQLQDSEEPPQQPWADVIPTTLLKTRYFARPSAGPGNDIFDGQEEVEVWTRRKPARRISFCRFPGTPWNRCIKTVIRSLYNPEPTLTLGRSESGW